MKSLRPLLLCTCAAVLAGCGSSALEVTPGEDTGYSTKDDALALLGVLYSKEITSLEAISEAVSLRQSRHAQRLADIARNGGVAALVESRGTVVPCPAGGNYEYSEGSGSYDPSFFASPWTVEFASVSYDSCASTSGSTQIEVNGREEAGNGSSGALAVYYYLAGSGSTPLREEGEINGDRYLYEASEIYEYAESDSSASAGDVFSLALDYDDSSGSSGDAFTNLAAGSGATPFVSTFALSSGAYTLDGPFVYSSDLCENGLASSVQTLDSLQNGDDDTPVDGQLRFYSSSQSMTVSFNADGSASVSFSSGGSASISASEMLALTSSRPSC